MAAPRNGYSMFVQTRIKGNVAKSFKEYCYNNHSTTAKVVRQAVEEFLLKEAQARQANKPNNT